MYLLYLKLKNTNGFTPQHCLEDKLDILFQFFFFRLKIYYIKLLLVINTITVLYSAFEPNKEARDINAIPVPNLTIRELKAIKDNAE